MSNGETEPITAPRSIWMAVMELSKGTEMALADRIGGVAILHADFDTKPFLGMHLKFIQGVQRGFEQETAEKLTNGGKADEVDVELDLTLAESMYLSLVIKIADFKGALTFKRNLWRVVDALYERGRK